MAHKPDDCYEESQPCGDYHPLPCGLDEACIVPVVFYDASNDSQEIWEDYKDRET